MRIAPDIVKPWLRTCKYGYLRWRAERLACRPGGDDAVPVPAPMAFIFGCGRSGTSILGEVFSLHPDVCYLREPGYMWVAIERATDFVSLYDRAGGRCIMDAAHVTAESRVRFARVFLSTLRRRGRKVLVEKTPINAMRIGFLETLAPQAKYVHITRDGVDVCRSIDRLASENTYKMGGKSQANQWWGTDNVKWHALLRDGIAAGYHAREAPRLAGHLAWGAYEWVVTLLEVDRYRNALADRLFEIRYPDLAADPRGALMAMCRHVGLNAPPAWLAEAASRIGSARRNDGPDVVLPPSICTAFNAYQSRFGFANRAVSAPSDG